MKKSDIVAGEYRWLTVVPREDQNGTELILERIDNPVAKTCLIANGSILFILVDGFIRLMDHKILLPAWQVEIGQIP